MFKIPLVNKEIYSGLEVEGGYIKFAQSVPAKGSRKIITLVIKQLASASEEDTAAGLKDIFSRLKTDTGYLVLCIPRHKITVRMLSFPTVNEKEIEEMVKLQSVKELPFSKEEMIADYLITERTKDGYVKAVLAIVHQDVANNYLSLLQKAGIEPQRVTFSTDALVNWYQLAFKQEPPLEHAVLIDMDNSNTEIVLLHDSHFGFSRGITFGCAQLKEDIPLRDKLVEEVRRTLSGYNREKPAAMIERILISQTVDSVPGLKKFLWQELRVPCDVVEPLKNINCKKDISIDQHKFAVSPLAVLGTVLDLKKRAVNLMPPKVRQKQTRRLGKERTLWSFFLFLGIIVLASLIAAKKLYDMQLCISYLDREIEKTAPLAKEAENMLKKIELIRGRQKIKGSSVDILRELHLLVPADISLSSFIYDEDNQKVVLEGLSAAMSEVLLFINTLEKSEYFRNVQLKYGAEKRQTSIKASTNFKIECSLEQKGPTDVSD